MLCYLLLHNVALQWYGWQAFTSGGLYFWWLRQDTVHGLCLVVSVNPWLRLSESSSSKIHGSCLTFWCVGLHVCVCVCVSLSAVLWINQSVNQSISVEQLFEAMLVSGKSSLHHHRYNRQNEEGSGSRLRLGECLLISAEMPGCFLISILQHTAVVHLLIIQEEGCGYLMLCFRAFFSVHFPCSAFIPLCSFVSPSCCILYCVHVTPTYALL